MIDLLYKQSIVFQRNELTGNLFPKSVFNYPVPERGKLAHNFVGHMRKPTICMSQIVWLMIVFLTHSRKSLERYSRQNTSDGISGHLNTSGLSIIYEIGNENFQFLPLGGAKNFIFWLHQRVQDVGISNPTNFNKYPIPLALIIKTRLRRVETLTNNAFKWNPLTLKSIQRNCLLTLLKEFVSSLMMKFSKINQTFQLSIQWQSKPICIVFPV